MFLKLTITDPKSLPKVRDKCSLYFELHVRGADFERTAVITLIRKSGMHI